MLMMLKPQSFGWRALGQQRKHQVCPKPESSQTCLRAAPLNPELGLGMAWPRPGEPGHSLKGPAEGAAGPGGPGAEAGEGRRRCVVALALFVGRCVSYVLHLVWFRLLSAGSQAAPGLGLECRPS